jgi:hypothetical protein
MSPVLYCWIAVLGSNSRVSVSLGSKSYLALFPGESSTAPLYHGFEVVDLPLPIHAGAVAKAGLVFNWDGSSQFAQPGRLFDVTLGATLVGIGRIIGTLGVEHDDYLRE